jgi:hypothetical protein
LHEHTFVDSNQKGNAAELAIAAEAARLGLAVLKPEASRYSIDEVDAIDAYCMELERCFLIPIGEVAGQAAVRLRLAPARNGQRAALHLAEQYLLGAVAQLEERRHGMAEVRGSSPLSSTVEISGVSPTREEVGAHEFRNRFGLYMERAAGGAET